MIHRHTVLHATPSQNSRALSRRRVLSGTGAALAALGPLAAGLQPAAVSAEAATPVAAAESDPLGMATPARVALAIEQLPGLAASILAASGAPGMGVAVVHNDELVFSGGFGVREVGTDTPVDAETVFLLASVSKPVSATVVAAVVGDGDITWQTRMADLAPGFALHDAWPTENVTLADLFAHRSGLKDHGGDVLEDLGFGRDEIIHRLRFLEPQYSFRAGYAYTNFGLTAAADVVARSLGTTWEDLSEERLYQPLGMTHTSSRLADFLAEPNHAVPHMQVAGQTVVAPAQRNPDPQSPAGGASSSARDLAQWVRLQLGQGNYGGQQLIPTAALDPTHRPQAISSIPPDLANQRTGFYGLGLNISFTDFGAVQWGHSGGFALGAGTAVYMLPGSGFGVLALANGQPDGAADALCLSLLDIATRGEVSREWFPVLSAYLANSNQEGDYNPGTDWSTPPAAPAPALPDDAYTGNYHDDFYGDIEVTTGADGLTLRIGPAPLEFALQHYDRDTFFWQPPGENAYGPSGLSFFVGPDGAAIAFQDDYLGKHGPGVIDRA